MNYEQRDNYPPGVSSDLSVFNLNQLNSNMYIGSSTKSVLIYTKQCKTSPIKPTFFLEEVS